MKTVTRADILAVISECTDSKTHITDWKKVIAMILKLLE